jgi:hypothetical protein
MMLQASFIRYPVGAFTELQKVMLASSCLSIHLFAWSSCYWTDFYETCYLKIYKNLKKIQLSLNYDKNNEHFM